MRYIGSISNNMGYYNFNVKSFINEMGKICKVSGNQVLDDVRDSHSDWDYGQIKYGNEITIYVDKSEGNDDLDRLSDGRKLVLNIDLDNSIQMRRDKQGFSTAKNYTGVNQFEDLNEVFQVKRDDYEKVIIELNDKIRKARDTVERWMEMKKQDYGVDDLRSLEGDKKASIVSDINDLFPDYNNPGYGEIYENNEKTAAYFLKYTYAYTYLYKSLFGDIFRLMGEDEPIDVLSIGCGSKVDMAGLKLALLDTNREKASYYGIDLNDWTKNDYCLFKDQGCFDVVNIKDFLRTDDNDYNAIKSNVVIFPYSMSELADVKEPWEVLLNELPKRLKSNTIYIASNIRSGDNEKKDESCFKELIEAIEAEGYVLQQPIILKRGIERVSYIKETEDGIVLYRELNIGSTNSSEDTVAGYLQSIKNIDTKGISCNATTGASYIRYNIAKFSKEEHNDHQRQ